MYFIYIVIQVYILYYYYNNNIILLLSLYQAGYCAKATVPIIFQIFTKPVGLLMVKIDALKVYWNFF